MNTHTHIAVLKNGQKATIIYYQRTIILFANNDFSNLFHEQAIAKQYSMAAEYQHLQT